MHLSSNQILNTGKADTAPESPEEAPLKMLINFIKKLEEKTTFLPSEDDYLATETCQGENKSVCCLRKTVYILLTAPKVALHRWLFIE